MEKGNLLSLLGIPCPQNTAKALLTLALLDCGEKLKILIDNGEPVENFLEALTFEEDFKICEKNFINIASHWEILIERVE